MLSTRAWWPRRSSSFDDFVLHAPSRLFSSHALGCMAAWEWAPSADAVHVHLPGSAAGNMVKALAVDVWTEGRVFVGLESGALRAHRATGELERELLPASADSAVLCLLVHERVLWSGGRDRLINCFSLERGRACPHTRTLRGHFAAVKGLYASGATNRVWSLSEDRTLRCWRAANGTLVLLIRSTEFLMLCAAVSTHRPCAVSAESSCIAVYRTSDGTRTALLEGHIGVVWALLTHGDHVYSGGEDGTVRIWSLANDTCLHILRGHKRRVTSLALSRDGSTLFSAGDGSVRAWRTDTGECTLIMLSPGGAAVRSLAVSQDGALLFAGGADAVVRQYSTCDGALLCEHVGHTDSVHVQALSPTGQLWSGSYDGDARGWLVQLPWQWTRENHPLWPPAFRAATRAFLCCVMRSDCAAHALAVGGIDTRGALLDAVFSMLAASIKRTG